MTTFLLLVLVFLLTSIISVITGSTSLITVPALFQAGVDPRVAVATNMFALTFMSAGGTIPFLNSPAIQRARLPALVGLTLMGSIIGALLVLAVPSDAMPGIIAVFMIGIAGFSILKRDAGIQPVLSSRRSEMFGYAATFLLGIYGGFFSGGYVTLLTAVYIALFGMTFLEAVATTKVTNIFSSAVATFIFMLKGVIDYKLGISLGLVMFAGAMLGARVAIHLNNVWLRRIFLITVILMAGKTLVTPS